MQTRPFARALSRLVLSALCLAACAAHADTVLITGANTGIGLEFAQEYAARHWTVIATHRHAEVPPSLAALASRYPQVRIEHLDVTSQEDVTSLARKLAGAPIDVLINNAGVYADSHGLRTQDFGRFDFSLMDTILAVNVKGPLIVTQTLYPNVKASRQKKIVAISSTVGSLTDPYPGTGGVFYRASKAALNREMQLLAQVVRVDGVSVLIMHPGVVQTERMSEYARKAGARFVRDPDSLTPAQSVSQMIETIERSGPKESGRFMRYDGKALGW